MTAKKSFLSMFVWWIMFWAVSIIPVIGRSATNQERMNRKLQYLAPRDHPAPPRMDRRIREHDDWTPYNQMEAERVMARRETAPEFAPETDRMEANTAITANASVPNKTTSTNSASPNSDKNQTDSNATTMLVPDSSTSQSSSDSNGSDSSHEEASDESTGSNESKQPVSSGIALLPGLSVVLLSSMLSML